MIAEVSIGEQPVTGCSFDVLVLTALCPIKGAGRVLHQSRHLHRGTDQPRHHRRCGAGAHTLPQQVRDNAEHHHTTILMLC